MIKAILIDPYAGTVTEVDHDPDTGALAGTYALLSGPPHDVDMVERVFLPNGDMIWLDENAKIRAIDGLRCFKIDGYPELLAGRGLLVGDGGQKDAPPTTTLAEATAKVTFDRPTYGAHPKAATPEARAEARAALLEAIAGDDTFDEIAHCLSLGIEIEGMLKGIDGAMELANRIGATTTVAVAAVSHKGHEYHVRIEACPHCEQRKAAASGNAE